MFPPLRRMRKRYSDKAVDIVNGELSTSCKGTFTDILVSTSLISDLLTNSYTLSIKFNTLGFQSLFAYRKGHVIRILQT